VNVVVTGARGFLGSAVVTALRGAGLPVVPVSRRPGPGITTVDDYGRSPVADLLVHTAEEADRAKVNALGEPYVEGTARTVRELAGRAGHLLYVSSGTVYGDQSDRAFRTDDPVHATDTYSRAKIRNEQIALDAGGAVVRPSNLCGPGMSPRNVLSDILRQLHGAGPLLVRDDTPVRDFLPVAEAALAVLAILQRRAHGIFNVGSGIGLSIRELAGLMLHSAGQAGREVVATHRSTRRSMNVLDITRTRERVGWAPRPTLHDLLDQTHSHGVRP
jgi:nucleoside-diphosphate-sugar epimerase